MSSSTTIYINQERPNIAQTVKSALFNYFDTMLPLEEMVNEDGFYIDVLESGLVVNQLL